MIETRALRKVYSAPTPKRRRSPLAIPMIPSSSAPPQTGGAVSGEGIVAVAALDLTIEDGELFGLLGPNGAGKTTTIGILTTRVRPTGGEAVVAGADVVREPAMVRRRIGVVPQRPNPDRSLSVIENLVFHASYFGISRSEASRRGERLLARLEI